MRKDVARDARLPSQAVAPTSPAGTEAATVAVARDAADIARDAQPFLAAACARVETAAVVDRQAWVWVPDSGTPDVEASADAATMALPAERTAHLHRSLQRRVAAAQR